MISTLIKGSYRSLYRIWSDVPRGEQILRCKFLNYKKKRSLTFLTPLSLKTCQALYAGWADPAPSPTVKCENIKNENHTLHPFSIRCQADSHYNIISSSDFTVRTPTNRFDGFQLDNASSIYGATVVFNVGVFIPGKGGGGRGYVAHANLLMQCSMLMFYPPLYTSPHLGQIILQIIDCDFTI